MGDAGRPAKFENPSAEARCALLKRIKTIPVVGLSPNPARPSYGGSAAIQGHGYTIVPIHPTADRVLGAQAYKRLADVPIPIDLVNVFRRAEFSDGVADERHALGVKAIWIQEDIVNEAAAQRAQSAGMTVVMDHRICKDYRRYCK